jgi:photosystem II stability/assembly factor-like uncharacterized protein
MGWILSPSLTLAQTVPIKEAISGMQWHQVGPANMGGRVTAVAGIPGNYTTWYIAGADGGVFKTTNGGTTFTPQFNDQSVLSVGALALAPSNPDIIYLGSGEGDPRNSVQYGDGVYRSDDGGETWRNLGLKETERIKRIVIHPDNPDWACVCALGKEWGPNKERGVFKTTDGGKTWKHVLYIDEDHGCSDIEMEPGNPDVLYAGMWHFRRKPWFFDDGGRQTAVYKSTDGGESWTTIMNGLPDMPMARIGLSVAASNPNIVYLITEFKETGTLYKSTDKGANWEMVNDDANLNFRPFYYSDVFVDPNNEEVVYTLSGRLNKSTDGGKTFETIGRSVHGDHQSIWIDPTNSNRIIEGSDGGFQLSWDAGETWDILNNIELSQFYQIWVDNREPYRIYGGLQDNGTWVGMSNSLENAGIMKRHWRKLAGGDGYYAVPIPGTEDEVYTNLQGGVIFHVDSRFGNIRNIHPYPKIIGSAGDAIFDHKYRFNWDSPIHVSPNDPNTVYFGGNVLFRSRDKGYSWEVISPDLTTNDKSKQQSSGGQIYSDNTAAEFHCTILTIQESPVDPDVVWIGTDDGNVQLTRDGGKTWTLLNNKIPGFPKEAWVAKIDASTHNAGTAIVTVDQHRLNDFAPYIFITQDYGQTWTKAVNGLPASDYVRVVRQSPHNPNFLVAGMETNLFASWDMGKNWTRINNNLPPVSVHDLQFQKRDRDLVIGTHGRGAWVLDDISAMVDYPSVGNKSFHVFPQSRPGILYHYQTQMENLGERVYTAPNPEFGAYINYYVANAPEEPVQIEIRNEAGEIIRNMEMKEATAGINRAVWDLRYNGPVALEGGSPGGWGSFNQGPKVIPGNYVARVTANGQSEEIKITVKQDPRMNLPMEDFLAKDKVLKEYMELISHANTLINASSGIQNQLKEVQTKLKENGNSLAGEAESVLNRLVEIDGEMRRAPGSMNFRTKPRHREEIMSLMSAIDGATARPTTQQIARIAELRADADQIEATLRSFISNELMQLNAKLSGPDEIKINLERRN